MDVGDHITLAIAFSTTLVCSSPMHHAMPTVGVTGELPELKGLITLLVTLGEEQT